MQYYASGLKISKKVINNFKDVCAQNDNMAEFMDSVYEKTDDIADRVGKAEFTNRYNAQYSTKLSFAVLLSDLKRLGIIYNKEIRKDGVKGAIIAIRLREDTGDDE